MKLTKWSTLGAVVLVSVSLASVSFAKTAGTKNSKTARKPAQVGELVRIFGEDLTKTVTSAAEKESITSTLRSSLADSGYPAAKLAKMSEEDMLKLTDGMDKVAQEELVKIWKAKLAGKVEAKIVTASYAKMEAAAGNARDIGDDFASQYSTKKDVKTTSKTKTDATVSKDVIAAEAAIKDATLREKVKTVNRQIASIGGDNAKVWTSIAIHNANISAETGVPYLKSGCKNVEAAVNDLEIISEKVEAAHTKDSKSLAVEFKKDGAEHTGTKEEDFCATNMKALNIEPCSTLGDWATQCGG